MNALRIQLDGIKGSPTEVYARIVGYYRSIRNWNKGKREEFGIRKTFLVPKLDQFPESVEAASNGNGTPEASKQNIVVGNTMVSEIASSVDCLMFVRKTCPNCGPVKSYLGGANVQGRFIDVDTDEGFRLATEHSVFAAPTVIFRGNEGTEIARAHNVKELKEILEPKAELSQ
jgi:hypothetical protein